MVPENPNPTPDFDLTAGLLCLDFVNTLGDRARTETEQLSSYSDLLAFGQQSRTLSENTLKALASTLRSDPNRCERVFSRAIALREALFRVVAGSCQTHNEKDVRTINGELGKALSQRQLLPEDGACCWTWKETDDPARPIWPVLDSAAQLLTSGDLGRVKECASESCTWLFLDRSRNGSRRWCDMQVCGNRAKARRHYRRSKAETAGT